MKKTLLFIFGIIMAISLISCDGTGGKKIELGNTKAYEVGEYKINLPETYQYEDLKEVKAEPNCIAMLKDKNGNYPDLWIYEDDCLGSTLKEHIMALDSTWNYNELSFYSNGSKNYARTVYDEDWYGENLINEHYYKIGNGSKVLSFDFAYPKSNDSSLSHEYIVAIAALLGF